MNPDLKKEKKGLVSGHRQACQGSYVNTGAIPQSSISG